MIVLYLTCANNNEADTIGRALLDERLVACVRQSNVSSSFWWNDKIEHDDEVLLTMESVEEKYDAIEAVVAKLHSYDEHVLTAVRVFRSNPGVDEWLARSIK